MADVDDDGPARRIEIFAAVGVDDGRPVGFDSDRWILRCHPTKDATGAHRGIVADVTPGPEERGRGSVRRGWIQRIAAGAASTIGLTTSIRVSMVSASYGAGSSTRNVSNPMARYSSMVAAICSAVPVQKV